MQLVYFQYKQHKSSEVKLTCEVTFDTGVRMMLSTGRMPQAWADSICSPFQSMLEFFFLQNLIQFNETMKLLIYQHFTHFSSTEIYKENLELQHVELQLKCNKTIKCYLNLKELAVYVRLSVQ